MTHTGHLVVGFLSIGIVAGLMIKSILEVKKSGKGTTFLLLIPVITFLINTI